MKTQPDLFDPPRPKRPPGKRKPARERIPCRREFRAAMALYAPRACDDEIAPDLDEAETVE